MRHEKRAVSLSPGVFVNLYNGTIDRIGRDHGEAGVKVDETLGVIPPTVKRHKA